MIRPWFRQAAVPWKTTATQTRASGENRVSTKLGVLQAPASGDSPAVEDRRDLVEGVVVQELADQLHGGGAGGVLLGGGERPRQGEDVVLAAGEADLAADGAVAVAGEGDVGDQQAEQALAFPHGGGRGVPQGEGVADQRGYRGAGAGAGDGLAGGEGVADAGALAMVGRDAAAVGEGVVADAHAAAAPAADDHALQQRGSFPGGPGGAVLAAGGGVGGPHR